MRGIKAVGKVVSERARKSLLPPATSGERNGLPQPPVRERGAIFSSEIVNVLRTRRPVFLVDIGVLTALIHPSHIGHDAGPQVVCLLIGSN